MSYSIWGRYDADYHARLACRRFEDQPGAWHRVRYMSSKDWPEFPWALCVYDWKDEADAFDANGEIA